VNGRTIAGAAALLLASGVAAALLGSTGSFGASRSGDGTEASASAPPARLLLVTLDTTRADRLGCYGCTTARTPGIDELASRGVLYEQAWTAAPITLSSHATILTGVYPCAHGVRDNAAFQVAPAARLLSEALKEAGFRTGAFVGSFVLDRRCGLDQGFDVYDTPDVSHLGSVWGVIDRPAGAVADAALRFIDSLRAQQPFFLWVHFYDPHDPHRPPAEFATDEAHAYEGEIAYCDAELRRILDHLRARRLDLGLVVAVTADHGESLHEHGEKTHGIFVYEATMRVPLIVAPPPPGVAPGTRLRAPVSIVDLAATLLERLGVGRAALPDARTAPLPGSDADADLERALYLESLTPYYSHHQAALRAVVWKGMKYIETTRPEIYSLGDDPGEQRDLHAVREELRAPLQKRLAALLAENPPLEWSGARATTSEEVRQFAQLGYVGAPVGGDPFAESDLADPKDRIGDLDLMDRIVARISEGSAKRGLDGVDHPELTAEQKRRRADEGRQLLLEARALTEKLREGNPKDPMVDVMLASISLGLGEFAEAVRLLEGVIALNPRHPTNHYNLSFAYKETGHLDWAKRELEKSAWLEPRSLYALRLLVEFAWREGDWPAAAWWLQELAKCRGITEDELNVVRQRRGAVQEKLNLAGQSPRPPAPLTDADLLPEGIKVKAGANR